MKLDTDDIQKQCSGLQAMVLMPRELTAENGAKALLSGEFHELIEVPNPDYDPSDDDAGPEFLTLPVPVSWATIKAIYAMVVEHLSKDCKTRERGAT